MHKENIHHGHFIDNDHIRLQRIFLISLEGSLCPILRRRAGELQKPVNGHCLITGRLRHSLGRTARRRRQKDLHILRLKISNDRIDRCRLTSSGTSRQNQKSILHRFHHCPALHLIQLHLLLPFHCLQFLQDILFLHPAGQIQVVEHSGRVQFHIVILAVKDHGLVILFLQDQFSIHTEIHHLYFNIFLCHTQKLRCPTKQHLSRQTGMSFRSRL